MLHSPEYVKVPTNSPDQSRTTRELQYVNQRFIDCVTTTINPKGGLKDIMGKKVHTKKNTMNRS